MFCADLARAMSAVDPSHPEGSKGRDSKGMSVLQIVEAMRKATGFDYKYEIVGRRCVALSMYLLAA